MAFLIKPTFLFLLIIRIIATLLAIYHLWPAELFV